MFCSAMKVLFSARNRDKGYLIRYLFLVFFKGCGGNTGALAMGGDMAYETRCVSLQCLGMIFVRESRNPSTAHYLRYGMSNVDLFSST